MREAWKRRRAKRKANGPLSPEDQAKISAAGMGRAPSAETRIKIAKTGAKATEESKAILWAAWVKRRQAKRSKGGCTVAATSYICHARPHRAGPIKITIRRPIR